MFRVSVLALAIVLSAHPQNSSTAHADPNGVIVAAEIMGLYKAFRDFCEKDGSILKPAERDAIYAFAEKFGYASGSNVDVMAGGHSERHIRRWRLLGGAAQCAEAEITLRSILKQLSQ